MTLPAELDQASLDAFLEKRDDALLVDVRSAEECQAEPREGWLNWPLDNLADHFDQTSPDQVIIFACKSGQRAKQARGFAQLAGFSNVASLVP